MLLLAWIVPNFERKLFDLLGGGEEQLLVEANRAS
jgi:hypothetical protein